MSVVRLLPAAFLLASAAACSDGGGSRPVDASPGADDASPDAPDLPAGCDYTELADSTNDASLEDAGLTPGKVLCGKIDTGHYDPDDDSVDFDAFTFTQPADSEVLLTITGAGIDALDEVNAVLINDEGAAIAFATYLTNHGITFGRVAAGNYILLLEAYHSAAIPASIDYKIQVTTDDSNARCPKSTATPNFVEVETTPNNLNDMVAVRFGGPPARQLTGQPDAPEATGATIEPGMKYRFTGVSEVANNAGDEYIDRDAFLVKTGATTDRLSIRVNWDSTTADLDFMVFPAEQINEHGSSTLISNSEDEFSTFSVLPNTDYWVWVGQYDAAGAAAAAYSISVCGEQFTP